MLLRQARPGDRIEIVALDDHRFARAVVLLGLMDGAVATVASRESNGSVVLGVGGIPVRVPAALACRLRIRRRGLDGQSVPTFAQAAETADGDRPGRGGTLGYI